MDATEILKMPYARLVTPDADGTFLAEIFEFPGCFAVGKSASEALQNLEGVAVDWLAAAFEQGQDIPEPMDSNSYSGKLVLRMSKGLHKRAALWADREGVSLNKFIVTCLAEAVGERARPSFVYATPTQFHAVANMSFHLVGGSTAMTPLIFQGFAGPPQQLTTTGSTVFGAIDQRERQRA